MRPGTAGVVQTRVGGPWTRPSLYTTEGTMTETRRCRACGCEQPLERYRRVAGSTRVRRRTCRRCENRQRTRRWLVTVGREIRPEYREPELTLGEHLRILEYERLERGEVEHGD